MSEFNDNNNNTSPVGQKHLEQHHLTNSITPDKSEGSAEHRVFGGLRDAYFYQWISSPPVFSALKKDLKRVKQGHGIEAWSKVARSYNEGNDNRSIYRPIRFNLEISDVSSNSLNVSSSSNLSSSTDSFEDAEHNLSSNGNPNSESNSTRFNCESSTSSKCTDHSNASFASSSSSEDDIFEEAEPYSPADKNNNNFAQNNDKNYRLKKTLHPIAILRSISTSSALLSIPANTIGTYNRPPRSPDALSSSKKYKFNGRIVPSTRSPFVHEYGDRNSKQQQQHSLPRFYWAEGKLPPASYVQELIMKAQQEYNTLKGKTPLVTEQEFGQYLVTLGIPLYWKKPFWLALGPMPDNALDFDKFLKFYKHLVSECPDDASRFIRVLWTQSKMMNNNNLNSDMSEKVKAKSQFDGCNKISIHSDSEYELPKDSSNLDIGMSDFIPMIQDIIDTHPGLGFLRDAPEFHSRYVTTVVSRIFYMVNRSWTGRITIAELRRSNVLRVIKRLEEETDVNNITEYFSYEHFYVIYCKFWELDKDHDLLIDKSDLACHSDRALSSKIVDRIFSGAVIRGWDMTSPVKCSQGKMTYSDFVWFLISEEDKKTPTAIEYWFRCLDVDGDGILSPYELQHFYSEQERRLECLGIEPLDFSNIYCQFIDMLRCSPTGIRLKDLKRNPQLASTIFNTLFNLDKYLDHEQRDPFSAAGSGPGYAMGDSSMVPNELDSDWDKYAAAEYELLIAEESPSDTVHETVSDFE